MRLVRGCAVVAIVGGMWALPGAAAAALPEAGARFAIHDHRTRGAAWHVELQIAKRDRTLMRMVVLYDERCDETIAAERVRLTPAGVLEASGTAPGTNARGGDQDVTWTLRAAFPVRHRTEGSFELTEADCAASHAFAGAHEGHRGTGGGGHDHGTSDPFDYPDIAGASASARAEARRMLRRVRAVARSRFPTIAAARAEGFNRYMVREKVPEPGIFHLWSRTYNTDASVLDPDRPESLVYWKPTRRGADPVLVAFMLRFRPGPRPRFAGDIPSFHTHKQGGDRMTHVWLARNLRGAYANCLPVPELERSLHAFDFEDIRYDGHESQACVQRPR